MRVIWLQKARGVAASRLTIWRILEMNSPAPTTVVALAYEILEVVSVILGNERPPYDTPGSPTRWSREMTATSIVTRIATPGRIRPINLPPMT